MEVHPGVFVSNVATEEWQADPEIGGGAEEHVLFDTGTMRAGLSRFTKDADQQPPTWVLPATQVLLVLEGEARVDIEDGPVLELKAGDMACLPKGAATTWHLTLPFKEMWVLAGEPASGDLPGAQSRRTRLGQFEQIAIRVAQIERADRSLSAGALDGPELNRNAGRVELGSDVIEPPLDKEAEVGASRRRSVGVRRDLGARQMQVELLSPEPKRDATVAEHLAVHAEPLIEPHGCLQIAGCEHQVVQGFDTHRTRLSARRGLVDGAGQPSLVARDTARAMSQENVEIVRRTCVNAKSPCARAAAD